MNKLLILLLSGISVSFGQENKLIKLLGPDFQSVPARAHIPYREMAPGVEIIPSLTIQGDTSGLVYQNEYLLFRNYEDAPNATASYVKSTFVSNAAYQEFQDWVRDSIAREKIILYSDRIEPVLKFIRYSEKELAKGDEIVRSHMLYALKRKHELNWKTAFKYDDPQWMPFVADMYLPQPQRFYKQRDFDKRVLQYRYFQGADSIDFFTSTIAYPEFWARQSRSVNDEYATLGQLYMPLLPELPVVGLTGMQAHAFCHWKEVQLQQELNKKKLPYKVRVTLPLMNELTKTAEVLTVPARDYTPQWKITTEDYRSFMQAVRDSIVLEHLFYQLHDDRETRPDALKFLPEIKERYFNEGEQEFKKTDVSDYEMIRYLYPIKRDPAVFKKYKEQVQEIEKEQEGHLDFYQYYRMDVRSKAVTGKLKRTNWGDHIYKDFLGTYEIDSLTEEPVGMDRNPDYLNKLGQGNGARAHENYRRFIRRVQLTVTPQIPIENQQSNELVKGISYEQALAYYHWKYPVWKAKQGADWQQYVFPSEEQFNRIQQGERIMIPQHSFNFPSPVFRYVVTFIRQ